MLCFTVGIVDITAPIGKEVDGALCIVRAESEPLAARVDVQPDPTPSNASTNTDRRRLRIFCVECSLRPRRWDWLGWWHSIREEWDEGITEDKWAIRPAGRSS
jgi:hypothetical protein